MHRDILGDTVTNLSQSVIYGIHNHRVSCPPTLHFVVCCVGGEGGGVFPSTAAP